MSQKRQICRYLGTNVKKKQAVSKIHSKIQRCIFIPIFVVINFDFKTFYYNYIKKSLRNNFKINKRNFVKQNILTFFNLYS